MNYLYYGDNLDILREYIPDESVDLIYLDPPFNSSRSYNVLFREANGTAADAQIQAFDDTWSWGATAERTLREIEATLAQLTRLDREKVMLMPQARTKEQYRRRAPAVAQLAVDHGYRFCPRLHMQLWGNRRGR